MTLNIWEERIVKDDGSKEPKKAFIYFQEYLNLGVGRKLSKVAENTGKTVRYIKKLSYTWDWVERANAYDMSLIEENKRESAVELDTSNGKVTNLSNKEIANIFMSAMTNGESDKAGESKDDGVDGKD